MTENEAQNSLSSTIGSEARSIGILTIGVDVGLTGALAILGAAGEVLLLADLPVFAYGRMKWIDALDLSRMITDVRGGRHARAAVEVTHAMPKLGTVAANSKGLTMGSTLSGLQFAGVSIELITPQSWKRALGLVQPNSTDKSKKDASLARARLLFPAAELDRAKDHGRAEALLIAHYAQRYLHSQPQAA